jgi:hypothetical protein
MSEIGFLVLTHVYNIQILRLLQSLNKLYNHPPIVCHHDFRQSHFPISGITKNINIIRSPVATQWGGFSIVEATVLGLKELCRLQDAPKWIVLLSGTDYPIRDAQSVINDLERGDSDVHMDLLPIRGSKEGSIWQRSCYERYCATKISIPLISKSKSVSRIELKIRSKWLNNILGPFSKNYQCYAGSQWFTLNRKAAQYIIESHQSQGSIYRHYSKLALSDESYFHTLIANSGCLRVNKVNWRYIDWSSGGRHPKTLGLPDLPSILGSNAHFARKFHMETNPQVLDEIDASLFHSGP